MDLWSAERVFVKGKFEHDWGIMVDDTGIIQAIGPRNQLVAKAKKVWHYPGRLIMPAITNPHHHGFHTIFRGLSHQLGSYEQLITQLLWPMGALVDDTLLEAAYVTAYAEQVLSGVSRVGEFHYLHNGIYSRDENPDNANKIIQIALSLGLEITLVYAFFDQGETEKAKAFIQPLDESIKRFRSLKERYKDDSRVEILPGIHGFLHSSDEAILAASALAKEFDCPWHIQLAERQSDLEIAQTYYGTTPLRVLHKMGVIDSHLVIINGSLLDEEEIQLAMDHQCRFVLTPAAALAKGDQPPNLQNLIDRDMVFSLGTDSSCQNQGDSFPSELRWLSYLNRNQEGNLCILKDCHICHNVWELGTTQALHALGDEGGPLMPGSMANFLMIDISGPTFRPRWNFDPELFLSQVVQGWGGRIPVKHLVIRGKTVVRSGYVTHFRFESAFKKLDDWSGIFLDNVSKTKAITESMEDELNTTLDVRSEQPPEEDGPSEDQGIGSEPNSHTDS
jgi:5-methylthioadenosine/S-adenosylhomocysteine deaminase